MPSPLRKIALAAAGLTVAAAASWAAPSSARGYHNDAMRVRNFEPPPTWAAAPQPSYPRMLVEYTHPDGGRLTLAAQKVPQGSSAETLAKSARAGLEKQGFTGVKLTPDGANLRLDARLDGGRRFLKQLYVVEGGLGYVLSLVAGSINELQMARDFNEAVRSLAITGEPPDGGAGR